MLENETLCQYCGEEYATVHCLGCGIPICNLCVRLEDYGFGCDCGKVVAFCPDCYEDPNKNTVLKFDDS